MITSPFSRIRFEFEREHLYYLPEQYFGKLVEEKPTYLIGGRGTGKTTLLKALSWSERLRNKSLKQALAPDPFRDRFVGLYMKAPKFPMGTLDKWLAPVDDEQYGLLFCLYLDLAWLELAAQAIVELGRSGIIPTSPAKEAPLYEELAEEYSEFFDTPIGRSATLLGLSKSLREARRALDRDSQRKTDPIEVFQRLPINQMGELGRIFGEKLGAFCDNGVDDPEQRWHFKVCIDEAENLSTRQVSALSSVVRVSEWPVFFTVAFVHVVPDISQTLFNSLTLQVADRSVIALDQTSPSEFLELCEGVASVRVKRSLEDSEATLSLSKVLGKLDINRLLTRILEESESSRARELLAAAEALVESPAWEAHRKSEKRFEQEEGFRELERGEAEGQSLPIYQAYIVNTLGLELYGPDSPRWTRRSQQSREIRKRMVAAYLLICKEIGKEVRYAFSEMVIQMSDGSIRDFLRQMHEIFKEAGHDTKRFLRDTVNLDVQTRALAEASRQKREWLPQSGVDSPREVDRLVEGLGRITSIVQKRGDGEAPLRSSERGRFVVDFRGRTSHDRLKTLVQEAHDAGFLKITEVGGDEWALRVHCSLAPFYQISYRGAYYDTMISVAELDEIRQASDEEGLIRLAERIGSRLAGDENLSLFGPI